MFVFYENFRFFRGIQITLFCHKSRIHRSTQCINFSLMLFKKWYEQFLVQIECSNCWKMILSKFLWFNSFVFCICYCGCKERKKWNELQIQYRTKSPHFWNNNFSCLQAKNTRDTINKKSSVFLIKRVRAQYNIFWVSNGWVVAVS